jgi:hypothetical protein
MAVSLEVVMVIWQESYATAVLETDNKKLEEGLSKTEGLIFLRMLNSTVREREQKEIRAAWDVMTAMRFERLGWPDYKTAARRVAPTAMSFRAGSR